MRRKRKLLTIIASLLVACCVCMPFIPTGIRPSPQAFVVTEGYVSARNASPEMQQPETESRKTMQIPCEERFISMLNLNTCFNISNDDIEALVTCASVSLYPYSYDAEGYGICISSYLLTGFIESFYGISLDIDDLPTTDAPDGYIRVTECGFASFTHSLVSISETANGYEVISLMESYYGGSDVEQQTVKSIFVPNTNSEFGYNLVSCEIV